jgi:HAD superfamily hydrolase (TIGR01509 family)
MSEQIDLIIFDCDGVLVDSEVIGGRVYADYLTSAGFPHSPEECDSRYLGMSDASMVHMFAAAGTPLPTTFIEDVHKLEREVMARDLEAIPGIGDVLQALETPFCLASSGHPAKISHSLAKTGLTDFFSDNVFSAVQIKNGKPAPDLFLHAAKEMNSTPGRAIVIEDSPAGVQAGVAAGMTVVGFLGGSHIQPGHDETLRGHGAHHIVDHMADLPALLATLAPTTQ